MIYFDNSSPILSTSPTTEPLHSPLTIFSGACVCVCMFVFLLHLDLPERAWVESYLLEQGHFNQWLYHW